MSAEWIAVAGALPDHLREMLGSQEPPAEASDMWRDDDWGQIFALWAQYTSSLGVGALPQMNGFIMDVLRNWSASPGGGLGTEPSAGELRRVYASYLDGLDPPTPEFRTAVEAVDAIRGDAEGHPDDDAGEEVSTAANELWSAVWAWYEDVYDHFKTDVARFGSQAEFGAEFLERTQQGIAERNRANMTALPDRHYMDLTAYNFAGTVLILLGDHPTGVTQALGTAALDTQIAKKRGLMPGSGDWIVPDPGQYLDWIQYELKNLGSPKSVKVAPIPDDFDAHF